nr:ABC transporter permease subunit [Lachnospiraceae bacterium]
MRKLLRADLYRMYRNKKIWIALLAMFSAAGMMISMQYSGMDYEVPLSRVIFLPMTFFGLVIAAYVGFYAGEDFSDGTVRNKIVTGNRRRDIYVSQLVGVWSASLVLYILTVLVAVSVGLPLFACDVGIKEVSMYFILGCFTVLAMGSIFYLISMCIGNRSVAITVCMGLAFLMLFLCLHTNQILAQSQYKNEVLNPHYVSGVKRICYELLHDMNPMGQIAQLSEMKYLSPVRWIVSDVLWLLAAHGIGTVVFGKKDIR